MRSYLIYRNSSLLRQADLPCVKQAFLDRLLPTARAMSSTASWTPLPHETCCPGLDQPRMGVGWMAEPGHEDQAGKCKPLWVMLLVPLGCIRKSFVLQEGWLLCNYFLWAVGELACPSGHGWVIMGPHWRNNQPRACDLANVTTGAGDSQAQGSGSHISVDLPSWPHLKGAPNTS